MSAIACRSQNLIHSLDISAQKCPTNIPLFSTELHNHELVCLRYIGNDSKGSLLQCLVTDIFSNFLLALVTGNRTLLENKFGETLWDKVLSEIGRELIDRKVCANELDTKLAIIPALLALRIKQENCHRAARRR
jgi:hypothetical protein